MRYLYRLSCLSALLFLNSFIFAQSPLKIGEEVETDISTEHPYNPEGKEGVLFEKEFNSPNSAYIKFYFEDFQLEGDDHLEIVDPESGERFIYAGGGKVVDRSGATISDFWSRSVLNDRAILRLHGSGKKAGSYGFDIKKVAYGFTEDSIASLQFESICGADDKEEIECHSGTTMYDRGEAVCRLVIGGSGLCTGWLLGDQGHVMTNNHCIGNSTDAQNTEFQFDYKYDDCAANGTPTADVVATSSTLICTDADLDYTLVELPTNPTGTYGYLSFRSTEPVDGERIYIPQHPGGDPKKISVNDDNSGTGNGQIQNNDGTNGAGLPTRVEYYTDTEGGSSGSPVIGYNDHLVVALHNTGGCLNGGNRCDSIISDMGNCMPNNGVDDSTFIVADFTMSSTKSCDGIVSFTDNSSNAVSWDWDFDDGSSSTQQDPSHTYSSGGTYTVQLIATNSDGVKDTATGDVTVTTVDTPTVAGDTICYGGSASLSANGSAGDILWYGDTTAAPLDTGGGYTTSPLFSDTSFFVRQDEGGITTQNVGELDNSFNTGTYFDANDNWGLYFDVHMPMILESVKVFSDMAANRTIELVHNGTVISSKTVWIGNGTERVQLDFDIPAGNEYLLKVTGATVNLYRNDGGASYPYEIPGLVSITGNNASSTASDYYYYFYDWEVHEKPCKSDWQEVQVGVVDSTLIDSVSVTDVQSCDGSDGELKLYASTGTTPYQYSADGGNNYQGSDLFTGLAPNTYELRVKDANGCTDSTQATVDPLPSPVIDAVDTTSVSTCGGSDGEIEIFASSGTPPYQYSKDGGSSFQGSSLFTGLSSGTYSIMVRDDSNCTASVTVMLESADQPAIDSVSVDDVLCNGESNGEIVVHASNVDSNSIDDGMSYQTSNSFQNLAPGVYDVKVKNVGGCKDSAQVQVNEPPELVLNGGSDPSIAGNCDGSAWVDVSGGSPGYSYQWDDPDASTNDSIDSLCTGGYTVIVTDANGCEDSILVRVDEDTASSVAAHDSKGEFRLYPVPAGEELLLEIPKEYRSGPIRMTLFDMLGKAVQKETLPEAVNAHRIDLRDRSEGVYILDLQGKGWSEQFKVPVKTR